MAPCLSYFPSVCLETIFSHVPLLDLLNSVGLVCTTWYKARHTELKRRRRLVIVDAEERLEGVDRNFIQCPDGVDLLQHVRREDGSPWLALESPEQIKIDSLVVTRRMLTISGTPSLLHLSNVTHLDLMFFDIMDHHNDTYVLSQVIPLIEHLSEHLVILNLNIKCLPLANLFHFPDQEEAVTISNMKIVQNVINLFTCLDRLPSLRHLTLFLCYYIHGEELRLRPQLSFLSRLSTLSIYIDGIQEDWFWSSLNRYATNVDSIGFYKLLFNDDVNVFRGKVVEPDYDSNIPQVGPHLRSKLKVASLRYPKIGDYANMQLFCARFNSLVTLKLDSDPPNPMPMTMLARCLSQLPELVHLDLHFTDPPTEEALPWEPAGEFAQVLSVRLLTIRIRIKSHNESEQLYISEIFPNVQVLRLAFDMLECAECEITRPNGGYHQIQNVEPEFARRLVRCTRLARQPFRRCVNLHTISLASTGNDTFITVNEL